MSDRWVGIEVSGKGLVVVDLEFGSEAYINADATFDIGTGDRARAYARLYEQLYDYIREHAVPNVAIKASALPRTGASVKHLHVAEIRGVAIAAAVAAGADVRVLEKAVISKKFGKRNADDYIADDSFWADGLAGDLRKGSREAALVALAARKR